MDCITAISHDVLTLLLSIHKSLRFPNTSKEENIGQQFYTGSIEGLPVLHRKGDVIGHGVSAIVELVPSGLVVKSPWPGDDNEECRQDLAQEVAVYRLLGSHKHLLQLHEYDAEEGTVTLEYMPNGNLDEYLKEHHAAIPLSQRKTWALSLAEALCLLHSKEVVHCDLKPKNMLLDANLGLKLVDFGSASIRGSRPTGCAGARFMPPGDYDAYGVACDIFAFGSTLYTIMSGAKPYADLETDEVWPLYSQEKFPDTSTLCWGQIILGCWTGEFQDAQAVRAAVESRFA